MANEVEEVVDTSAWLIGPFGAASNVEYDEPEEPDTEDVLADSKQELFDDSGVEV